jgi:hypothetical protein
MILLTLPMLLSCSRDDEPVDVGDPVQDLVLPDIEGVDMPAAYQEALLMSLSVTLSTPWQGNIDILDLAHDGCPDLYVGAPEDADLDDDEQFGISWFDYCQTPGGLYFGGYVVWDGDVTGDGDADSDEGHTIQGSRQMLANAVVGDEDTVLYEFKGEGSDSLYLVEAPDYTRWAYSSLVEATVTGDAISDLTGTDGGGWRTDLYLYATGGNADYIESRGNIFLFDALLSDRFDSVAMDLTFSGPTGAAPDACTAEPVGWIGLRDENAYWYDLVFQPADATDSSADDTTYSACDGCGTLYIRGIETTEYGEVCMDFSWLWDSDPVTLPAPEDFIFTIQNL